MAFESLSNRLNNLPFVLAGPILRRVEHDKVNVWFACKTDGVATLKIWSINQDPQTDDPILKCSNPQPFLKLGNNLFVACIQANFFSGEIDTLYPEIIYQYDIEFNFFSSGISGGMQTPSIVTENGNLEGVISFQGLNLPTFVIPNSDVKKLHILHGSCRKPHGEGLDAMRGISKVIQTNLLDGANRPQMLFLTGDQIYADDVSPNLLYLINDAKMALLNWEEPFPITFILKTRKSENGGDVLAIPNSAPPDRWPPIVYDYGDESTKIPFERYVYDADYDKIGSYDVSVGDIYDGLNQINTNPELPNSVELDSTQFSLLPSRRSKLIRYSAGFTVDDAVDSIDKIALSGNHLMLFGEFSMMYMLVWSPVLWPLQSENMPSYGDIYRSGVNSWDRPEFKSSKFVDIVKDFLGFNSSTNFVENAVYQSQYFRQFSKHHKSLWEFKQTNEQVRLALANISCYMVFDDHEITDDLFLNFDWCAQVLGTPKAVINDQGDEEDDTYFLPAGISHGRETGRRIIANGLSAVALFQYWGNYSNVGLAGTDMESPLSPIFERINQISSAPSLDLRNDYFKNLDSYIVPKIHRIKESDYSANTSLNFINENFVPEEGGVAWSTCETYKLVSNVNWFFDLSIKWNGIEKLKFVGVDIRTKRSFKVSKKENIIFSRKCAGLISMEDISSLDLGSANDTDCTFIISGAPVFGHPIIEGLVEGVILSNPSKDWLQIGVQEEYDAESWSYNRPVFEYFLNKLSEQKKIVILSGDVHYGYCIKVDYWNKRSGALQTCPMIQLTASSFKNETSQTRFTEKFPTINLIHFGWKPSLTSKPKVRCLTINDLFQFVKNTLEFEDFSVSSFLTSVIDLNNSNQAENWNNFNRNGVLIFDSLMLSLSNSEGAVHFNDLSGIQKMHEENNGLSALRVIFQEIMDSSFEFISTSLINSMEIIENSIELSQWLMAESASILNIRENLEELWNITSGALWDTFIEDLGLYYSFLRDNGVVVFSNSVEVSDPVINELFQAETDFLESLTEIPVFDFEALYGVFLSFIQNNPNYELLNHSDNQWVFSTTSFWPHFFSIEKYQTFKNRWNLINDSLDWYYINKEKLSKTIKWLKNENVNPNENFDTWKDTPISININWPLAILRKFLNDGQSADWFYSAKLISQNGGRLNMIASVLTASSDNMRNLVLEDLTMGAFKLLKSYFIHNLLAEISSSWSTSFKFGPFHAMCDTYYYKVVNTSQKYTDLLNKLSESNLELATLIIELDFIVLNNTSFHDWIRPGMPISFIELLINKSEFNGTNDFAEEYLGVESNSWGDEQIENSAEDKVNNRNAFRNVIISSLSTPKDFINYLSKALELRKKKLSGSTYRITYGALDNLAFELINGIYPSNVEIDSSIGRNHFGQLVMSQNYSNVISFTHSYWFDPDFNLIPELGIVQQELSALISPSDLFFLPYMEHTDDLKVDTNTPPHG